MTAAPNVAPRRTPGLRKQAADRPHPRHGRVASPWLPRSLVAVVVVVLALAMWSRTGPSGPDGEKTTGVLAREAPLAAAGLSKNIPIIAAKSPMDPLRQRVPLKLVPHSGSGQLLTVPGVAAAPGRGQEFLVRVQVESELAKKLGISTTVLADFVLDTLNDQRSWAHGGARKFSRTAGQGKVNVILASATTSEELCRKGGLRTYGKVSCSVGDRAILNADRWADGTKDFADIRGYRQYLINHEVGHVLGYGHESCPGAGKLAPVMQQQTKGVAPCRVNYWPFP